MSSENLKQDPNSENEGDNTEPASKEQGEKGYIRRGVEWLGGIGMKKEDDEAEKKAVLKESEETERQLKEQYRILAEGMVDSEVLEKEKTPISTEGSHEKGKELKMPKARTLKEVLGGIDNEEDKQKEWSRMQKIFSRGERISRFKDGKLQYLRLKEGTEGGKIPNEDSDLTFIVYDKKGNEMKDKNGKTVEITKNIGTLKYREWRRLKEGQVPQNGDVYIRRTGEVTTLKMTERPSPDQLNEVRRCEDENRNVAYRAAIVPRSEAQRRKGGLREKTDERDPKKIDREVREIVREIKNDDYEKAKKNILERLTEDEKKEYKDPVGGDKKFNEYLEDKNPYNIDRATYVRLLAKGTGVDQIKKEGTKNQLLRLAGKIRPWAAWGGVAGFGVGVFTVGSILSPVILAPVALGAFMGGSINLLRNINDLEEKVTIPKKDGSNLEFKSQQDLNNWIIEQEEKIEGFVDQKGRRIKGNIEHEAEYEANRRNSRKLAEDSKTGEIVDEKNKEAGTNQQTDQTEKPQVEEAPKNGPTVEPNEPPKGIEERQGQSGNQRKEGAQEKKETKSLKERISEINNLDELYEVLLAEGKISMGNKGKQSAQELVDKMKEIEKGVVGSGNVPAKSKMAITNTGGVRDKFHTLLTDKVSKGLEDKKGQGQPATENAVSSSTPEDEKAESGDVKKKLFEILEISEEMAAKEIVEYLQNIYDKEGNGGKEADEEIAKVHKGFEEFFNQNAKFKFDPSQLNSQFGTRRLEVAIQKILGQNGNIETTSSHAPNIETKKEEQKSKNVEKEKGLEEKVSNVGSLYDLYNLLKSEGKITLSDGQEQDAKEIVDAMRNIREETKKDGLLPAKNGEKMEKITNEYGIKDKFYGLLKAILRAETKKNSDKDVEREDGTEKEREFRKEVSSVDNLYGLYNLLREQDKIILRNGQEYKTEEIVSEIERIVDKAKKELEVSKLDSEEMAKIPKEYEIRKKVRGLLVAIVNMEKSEKARRERREKNGNTGARKLQESEEETGKNTSEEEIEKPVDAEAKEQEKSEERSEDIIGGADLSLKNIEESLDDGDLIEVRRKINGGFEEGWRIVSLTDKTHVLIEKDGTRLNYSLKKLRRENRPESGKK